MHSMVEGHHPIARPVLVSRKDAKTQSRSRACRRAMRERKDVSIMQMALFAALRMAVE
ncbi:MAG: hypothetical protein WC692_05540 [Erythrobacter sp.]|jgi:hypothetical protein